METPNPSDENDPERAAAAGSAGGWGQGQTIGTKLYPGFANEAGSELTSNDESAVNGAFGSLGRPR
jgi:hypothetical protein